MTAPRPGSSGDLGGSSEVRRRQPHSRLLIYYTLTSLLFGPFFPFAFLPFFFRYRTLRYEFDGEGVTMRWGILFRREISLTYARIQDIHLTSNVVERWLGLARIQIQTASGSAGAEMTIEGLRDFEMIRDGLYSRMRGVRERRGVDGHRSASAPGIDATHPSVDADLAGGLAVHGLPGSEGPVGELEVTPGELAAALQETAAELRRLREALAGAISRGDGHV
jgi:putative membrane protein